MGFTYKELSRRLRALFRDDTDKRIVRWIDMKKMLEIAHQAGFKEAQERASTAVQRHARSDGTTRTEDAVAAIHSMKAWES